MNEDDNKNASQQEESVVLEETQKNNETNTTHSIQSQDSAQSHSKNLSNKKNINSAVLIIFLIILLIGIFIFGYKNHLIGFKKFTNNLFIEPIIIKEKENNSEHSLNATQSVSDRKKTILNLDKKKINQNDTDIKTSHIPRKHSFKKQKTFVDTKSSIYTKTSVEEVKKLNYKNYMRVKKISQKFIILMNKLNIGDRYLNELIDLKTQIKNSKTSIPTLTEYASAGFPTDVIIISDGLKILKKLLILQSRKQSHNIFEKIINKFIIVTPTSKMSGFSGILFDIKKYLQDGDFEMVLKNIAQLTEQQQKSFSNFQLILKDKKNIQTEIKLLNDALIHDIFI
jgi:hypothetical protein